jgi:phosphoserine aminotransferase
MEKRSIEKANLLYSTIDALPIFDCPIVKEDRSNMNAVFFIKDEKMQTEFLDLCTANGMIGVKGYRTVGGIRVSMYNALELESVKAICNLMQDFANKKG